MSKPRKPDSRRPSKKELQMMQEIRNAEKSRQQYTCPTERSEAGIEACKRRHEEEGKLCYCKDICACRRCQENKKKSGGRHCDLEFLKREGGCAYGCSGCSECRPCY